MSLYLKEFFKKGSSVGILLMAATVLAMIFANSPLHVLYDYILESPFEIRLGRHLHIYKPLLLWINDGMMAVFFLLIGLEVKREVLSGQLSTRKQVILPGVAALGGMIVPALIYIWFNAGDSVALSGWAIPAATDIAFALGILALLGDRAPASLKIFLLALAIMDDLGAIVIIALFYSSDLSVNMLVLASVFLALLTALNRRRVDRLGLYIWVGVFLWVFVLKSGVHATLAGVALAFAIPLHSKKDPTFSPLEHLEHALQPWVNFFILPLFAFANAGIPLAGMGPGALLHPVPLGIMFGLTLGKLVGVFGFSTAAIKLGVADMPPRTSYVQLFGVSALCGIGFTMSLFIGGLAFQHTGGNAVAYLTSHRIGILAGSLLSGVVGYLILSMAARLAAARRPVARGRSHEINGSHLLAGERLPR